MVEGMNLRTFLHAALMLGAMGVLPSGVMAQTTSLRNQLAELSQRFSELEQQYNLMKLEVQNVMAENNRLKQDLAEMKKLQAPDKVEALIQSRMEAHRAETAQMLKEHYDRVLKGISATMGPSALAQAPSGPSSAPVSQEPRSAPSGDYPRDGLVYTVQMGDTLSKIASMHGSTVRYIQDANRISNPNTVQVGQKLFIPIEKR
jgi:regulator of replication initiation timing